VLHVAISKQAIYWQYIQTGYSHSMRSCTWLLTHPEINQFYSISARIRDSASWKFTAFKRLTDRFINHQTIMDNRFSEIIELIKKSQYHALKMVNTELINLY